MADEGEALFTDDVEEATEDVTEPEPQAEETPPAEPEAEPEPAPEPEPQPERPDAGFVPIAAMMDERDKRRAAEAELAKFRQQKPQEAPDPFDDPVGFAGHQTNLVQQQLAEQRFAMSDMFARKEHGGETVEKAVEWAQSRAQADPVFASTMYRHPNPVDWIVQQHKRDALLSDMGDNPDDWFAREAAKRGFVQSASVAATPVVVQPQQASPPVKVPPRSLATQGSGPSDVRDVATGPLAGVDAVFPN